VASVVTSAVENSRSLIEMAGHKLIVEVPPEPSYLEGDLDPVGPSALEPIAAQRPQVHPAGRGQIDLSVQSTEKDLTLRVREPESAFLPKCCLGSSTCLHHSIIPEIDRKEA